MKHDAHTHHIMNDTDSFYIRLCHCGVVHLCFGPTTVNMTEQAVIAVTETLKDVTHQILSKRSLITHPDPVPHESNSNVIRGNFEKLS